MYTGMPKRSEKRKNKLYIIGNRYC